MFKSKQYGLFLRLYGNVQGVGMRKAVKQVADGIQGKGFVWNHEDGSVCVVILGSPTQILTFQVDLQAERGKYIAAQQSKALVPAAVESVKLSSFEIIDSPYSAGKHVKFLLSASDELWSLADNEESAQRALHQVLDTYAVLEKAAAKRAELALDGLSKRYAKARSQLRSLFVRSMPKKLLPHAVVSQAQKFEGLKGIASFRELVALRARQQHIMPNSHRYEWVINNKLKAYEFADLTNVARPAVKNKIYQVKDLPKLANKVIKPLVGKQSIGVFMMKSPEDITEVATGDELTSFGAMKERMRKLLASKGVSKDEWIVEELVYGDTAQKSPPRDFKFLCFFGKVMLIREIVRLPTPQDCWWDGQGNLVDTGTLLADKPLSEPMGVTAEMIKMVESLGKKIPAPFMRIDFMLSDGNLVFNEFTPRPGSYAQFNEATDRRLGDAYLKAESRLTQELLQGAKFSEFKRVAKFRGQ